MTWDLPNGYDYWDISKTGIGGVHHRGPIQVNESGALLLYQRGPMGELDLIAAYGPGMWVTVDAMAKP